MCSEKQEATKATVEIEEISEAKPGLIHQKMIDVMRDIPVIREDREHGIGYRFRSHTDIMNVLNPIFKDHGIVTIQNVIEKEIIERKNKIHVFIRLALRFTAEDGSYVTSVGFGEGIDGEGHAAQKCISYTLKSILTATFLIPTDDANGDKSKPAKGKPQNKKPTGSPKAKKPTPKPASVAPTRGGSSPRTANSSTPKGKYADNPLTSMLAKVMRPLGLEFEHVDDITSELFGEIMNIVDIEKTEDQIRMLARMMQFKAQMAGAEPEAEEWLKSMKCKDYADFATKTSIGHGTLATIDEFVKHLKGEDGDE